MVVDGGDFLSLLFARSRNRWFLFNDEEVREMKIEELVGKQTAGGLRSGLHYVCIFTP